MTEGRPDLARAVVDASFLSQHRSRAYITSIRADIAQIRRAIAASHELLKRHRQPKLDEALRDERHLCPRSMQKLSSLCFEPW
ncbi:hypothetical protein C7I87_02375 [Mesorhizobium sp. SARCC-RB16n]|nr:hypothetical protein C7I87_02375 [Mesorhizobium sp. SARCC-RB16n]